MTAARIPIRLPRAPLPAVLRALAGAFLCATLLAGCNETMPLKPGEALDIALPATQQNDAAVRDALRVMAAMQDRLDHVAAPLLIRSQSMCRTLTRPLLGFTARNKYSYSARHADAAREALGLGDLLQVTGIMADSGAAQSGLMRGDALLAVGGQAMPQGRNAEYDAPAVLVPLIVGQSSIKLNVLREGQSKTLSVPLTRACGIRVELGSADNVASYSDGRRILITRGMLKFVRSDDELAYVIAKEMAHTVLGHPQRYGTAAASRDLINQLMQVEPRFSHPAIKALPKEADAVADRLALHMLVRSGYKVDGAVAFWQRLAKDVPDSVADGHTAMHPDTAHRLAAIEQTVEQIKARRPSRKK